MKERNIYFDARGFEGIFWREEKDSVVLAACEGRVGRATLGKDIRNALGGRLWHTIRKFPGLVKSATEYREETRHKTDTLGRSSRLGLPKRRGVDHFAWRHILWRANTRQNVSWGYGGW